MSFNLGGHSAPTTVNNHVRGKHLIAGWNLDKMNAFLPV